MDLEPRARQPVLDYVKEKWGTDRVCQIRTKTSFKPKGAIRDVCRVLGKPIKFAEEITSLIPPSKHGIELKFQECIEAESKLLDPKYKEVVDIVRKIEGITRHYGIHAAGLCISPVPLVDLLPIELVTSHGKKVQTSQYSMEEVEEIGLIKLDLLNLRNLTSIKVACEKIGMEPDDIPLDDPLVYKAINNKLDLSGIFQFEASTGVAALLRDIRPEKIEDIAACTSLFRPGPLASKMDRQYLRNRASGEGQSGVPCEKEIFKRRSR